ncbi:glycosyltransferase family 2 protein [Chitinophaga rhizophila]|uniref:Glycosyltransferase family 2 protein n=1 Tax=Chitinophaga rhizophila TaxID=2866212 RepID=A0ABS7GIH1_9BACT|nr:glycosyltransferase family 2 protein [Chitinophaga rhizophila]MBW8686477.1 glycosyltransferase family 2 protein [Chitinophaga rhizophila]
MSSQTAAQPLVSIVVATYNGAKYIEAQMDSLIAQTYPNTEIVVVDDRSTDNTLEILQRYARQYSHVHVYQNEVNLGYVKNFERGVTLSTGAYVSFSDQDDIWLPEKTAELMAAIGDHPMIISDSEIVTENLEKRCNHSDLKVIQDFYNPLMFATDNCVTGHSLIIKRAVVEAAIPFPDMAHDLWLGFFGTLHGTVKYFDKAFVKWRQHGRNVTTTQSDEQQKIEVTKFKLRTFRDTCPPAFEKEKAVFDALLKTYDSYSLVNNFNRMRLYFTYKKYLLAMKKGKPFKIFTYCIKMFFQMRKHP